VCRTKIPESEHDVIFQLKTPFQLRTFVPTHTAQRSLNRLDQIRHGAERALPPPGDLSPDGRKWEGPHVEQNRAGCWEVTVAREAGRFLNWCDRAGILVWSKNRVYISPPEEPFTDMVAAADAKAALRDE